jgi:cytoskeletal protein CcmA (bactofilin family)
MAEDPNNLNPDGIEGEDLENPSETSGDELASQTVSAASTNSTNNEAKVSVEDTSEAPKQVNPNTGLITGLLARFNIYIFVLVILVMLAVVFILIAYFGSKSSTNASQLVTENLTPATLKQIAGNDTNIGSSNEVLNIAGSSIFSGNILAKSTLQVAGNLTVGGTVALNNLSINGTGQFGQLNVTKNLSVTGDSNIQGNQNIGKTLQVNGGATFGGAISAPQVTTTSLSLAGDLVISHHIDTSGSIPTVKSGNAIGTGGTVSISGDDTAGNLSINTGTNVASGCFATIIFTTAFNKTPFVEITPVGAGAGGLAYYVTQSNTSFSICDASSPPASASFGFNYFVID